MSSPHITLGWPQLQAGPDTAESYALYVSLLLAKSDPTEFAASINAANTVGAQPEQIVVRIFPRHVLYTSRKTPYELRLTGASKLRHSGSVEDEQREFEGFVWRRAELVEQYDVFQSKVRHKKQSLAEDAESLKGSRVIVAYQGNEETQASKA